MATLEDEDHLTENEEEEVETRIKRSELKNFYKFLSTQAQKNEELADYLKEQLGLTHQSEVQLLDNDQCIHIYNLLDASGKKTMRNNYLGIVKIIVRNPRFTFPPDPAGTRKYKKHRKSRKDRNSRKGRKTRKYT